MDEPSDEELSDAVLSPDEYEDEDPQEEPYEDDDPQEEHEDDESQDEPYEDDELQEEPYKDDEPQEEPAAPPAGRGPGEMVEEFAGEPAVLACCVGCNRKFAVDRLEKHQSVCTAKKTNKRKTYSAQEARWSSSQGAEDALKFIELAKKQEEKKVGGEAQKSNQEAQERRKNKWRRQSAQLRSIAKRSSPRDGAPDDGAPPDPALLEDDDRVPCPHCGRRFVSRTANP